MSHAPASASTMAEGAVQSYAVAYGWGAGFFAVGAVLSVLLFRRRSSTPEAPAPAEPVLAH